MNIKSEILKFRVTPEQRVKIQTKAIKSNKTLSMYLRDCALEKEITVINGADLIAKELSRVGNNLNQISFKVNSGCVTAVDLSETKKELKNIWQSLNTLIQNAR